MDLNRTLFRFSIFILLSIFLFVIGCYSSSWVSINPSSWIPIKKDPARKAKTKELVDKEVILVEGKEYVKVMNPKASEGGNQPKFLYVPVDEYLSKKETFILPVAQKEEAKKEPIALSTETLPATTYSTSVVSDLKKKILITHFDDRTTQADETFGDWITEKLMKELHRRSLRVLFVDYQMVKEFLQSKGIPLTELQTPKTLNLLNEVFGVQALVYGHLSGPYVFTSRTEKDKEGTASAIIRIDVQLLDASTGKTLKGLSASNPMISTKEKGSFSDEKAKVKAIDLAIVDLGRTLSREMEGLDWFCRVAKVDGEEIYLNAGRVTGLKVGDVMEVSRQGEVKGKIRITAFLGMDASTGKLIDGKKPKGDDILKPVKGQGT
jgi:hypothetical protein